MDIGKLVGKRGLSAFISEIVRDEIQRRQQRRALQSSKGAWNDSDHPELKAGAAAWVRQMRAESKKRLDRQALQRRNPA